MNDTIICRSCYFVRGRPRLLVRINICMYDRHLMYDHTVWSTVSRACHTRRLAKGIGITVYRYMFCLCFFVLFFLSLFPQRTFFFVPSSSSSSSSSSDNPSHHRELCPESPSQMLMLGVAVTSIFSAQELSW